MKMRLLLTVSAGTMLALTGCAKPRAEVKTFVSVRFATPPMPERLAVNFPSDTTNQTLADTAGELDPDSYIVQASATPPPAAFTVALWGGQYNGDDVTFTEAPLYPGNYTFGFWNHDHTTAMKGWINVNNTGNDLVDTLNTWIRRIPQQKRWIAYNHEIHGKLEAADAAVFQTFAKEIRAFDQLERDLKQMVRNEVWMESVTQKKHSDMLNDSVVLFLPVGGDFFHPTTLPTFDNEDIAHVEAGDPITKVLLVADAVDTQRKLNLVNNVTRDLIGCRAVLAEEVNRLEQRKRYYLTTDHIYHHDRKFVENEMQLQQTLAAIDQVNEQINCVRERRLALAFTAGLVAPDRLFDPIDQEHRDLAELRTVLETEQQRFDVLFEQAHEDSPRRVVLQRLRQRVRHEIEDINRNLDMLNDARVALESMKGASKIIQRQGDTRLLAASFVQSKIPFNVRQAIENDAVMTVRLEKSTAGLLPSNSDLSPARTASYIEP